MGSTPMTAAVEYLSQVTDKFFESLMCRAARRINARQQLFPRHMA
jgi:hypothetical protein